MNDHGARVAYLSPYYPTVALPCTPCTWPRVPGSGAEPRKKILLLDVIFYAKRRAPLTHSTLFESSRRDLRESGHTGGLSRDAMGY